MVKILALGGDGIGPEMLEHGLRIANKIAQFAKIDIKWEYGLLHGASYDKHGTFCSTCSASGCSEASWRSTGAKNGSSVTTSPAVLARAF